LHRLGARLARRGRGRAVAENRLFRACYPPVTTLFLRSMRPR